MEIAFDARGYDGDTIQLIPLSKVNLGPCPEVTDIRLDARVGHERDCGRC